jgi:hypothetical protein
MLSQISASTGAPKWTFQFSSTGHESCILSHGVFGSDYVAAVGCGNRNGPKKYGRVIGISTTSTFGTNGQTWTDSTSTTLLAASRLLNKDILLALSYDFTDKIISLLNFDMASGKIKY